MRKTVLIILKRRNNILLGIVILLLAPIFIRSVFAHTEELLQETVRVDIGETISSLSGKVVIIASVLLLVLSYLSLKIKKQTYKTKITLFFSIVFVTVVTTLFLAASTIYLNVVSSSGGPVHWHADYEFWACGRELELHDPKGLSNRIGSSTLHEHNDKRIHLEGVVVDPHDASLENYFRIIGGTVASNSITFPTGEGPVSYVSGQTCPNGMIGKVQVFLFTVKDGYYMQRKLADPAHYIMASHGQVPPGDCIIIEFDEEKNRTDKLCESYQIAERLGKIKRLWE